MVADTWYAAEEMENALLAYEMAGKASTEGEIDLRRGYILVDLERWEPAIEALEAALEGPGQIPAGGQQPEAELSVAEQVGALSDSRSEDSVKALRGWLDQRE